MEWIQINGNQKPLTKSQTVGQPKKIQGSNWTVNTLFEMIWQRNFLTYKIIYKGAYVLNEDYLNVLKFSKNK